ncbi:unnamed protein product, partial [Allacma fusca]
MKVLAILIAACICVLQVSAGPTEIFQGKGIPLPFNDTMWRH